MARIRLLEDAREPRELPLAASTVIGRLATTTWALHADTIPAVWLELRWLEETWAWRVLADAENTRGPAGRVPGAGAEWRELRIGGRIRGRGATVELVEGGPPQRFAVDLSAGRVVAGEELDPWLDERADGPWPLTPDAAAPGPIPDGGVFVAAGRALRLHLAEPADATIRTLVDLLAPDARVGIDLLAAVPRLSVLRGDREIVVEGTFVRAAVPYAEARVEGVPRDGWLQPDEAWQRWIELGGDPEATLERVTQDRSRLVRALAGLGVANAKDLFETRNERRQWVTRVTVEPDRIDLD